MWVWKGVRVGKVGKENVVQDLLQVSWLGSVEKPHPKKPASIGWYVGNSDAQFCTAMFNV